MERMPSFLLYVVLFFIFHSSSSPFFSSSSSSSSSTVVGIQCHPNERSVLLQLKSSFSILDISHASCYRIGINGTPYLPIMFWNKNTNCCQWDGITCDRVTGHVIGLDLTCNMLKGTIHPNSSLFFLHHLQILYLSGNDFSGSPILPEFGQFKHMKHLSLYDSNFSGNVPLEISHLSKLVSLRLGGGDCKLSTGAATFKALARNLTNLTSLDLCMDMSLVPLVSLMNLSSSLTTLNLHHCQLRGELPENIFQSHKLQTLDLSGNHLSGQIPWSFLNLESLSVLDLSNNSFVGQLPELYSNSTQTFSSYDSSEYPQGSFPSNLNRLDLSSNLLNGTMPSWIFALPNLRYLSLRDNLLTGEVRKFSGTSLNILLLSRNKLHGTIPRSIFQLVNLQSLDLSSNHFMVNLEFEDLSKLKELTSLDLSSNNISWSFNSSKNYTIDNLFYLGLSSCNMIEFPNFLRSFNSLGNLDLSSNQIHGSVPKWLWELDKDSLFSLNLSHNFLTYMEPLPWNNLRTLDLRSNLFSGPLPVSSSPNLSSLLASTNQFSGVIPTSFCDMAYLQVLDVSYNNLSGNIPPCFGNLSTSLEVLDLQMNRFHGMVPPAFGKGCDLRTLNINGNELEGSLPRSLLNCEKLEVLDVGDNKINGSFPQWLESLTELQVLILKSNRFNGPIGNPKVRFPFQKLRIMDLSNNEFTGHLPTKYFENFTAMIDVHMNELEYMGSGGYYQDSVVLVIKGFDRRLEKILTIFTTIDFSRNKFEGKIPRSIGKLNSLKGLNFSHNKLSGPIPPSLGNLSNLESLDLSTNELFGDIPWQLAANLNQLAILNLSNNKLEGPIPHGKQFDTFSNDSYRENPELCGFPLSESCNNDEARRDPGAHDGEHNNLSVEWKAAVMGYGSGMIIGISVGYMVLFSESFDYWFFKRFGGGQRRKTNARLRGRRRSN